MEPHLRGLKGFPVNVGLRANARLGRPGRAALLEAGAIGFKIHEDYGASPELINATLRFAEHATSRSASTPTGSTRRPSSRDTVAAIAGRTVRAYHVGRLRRRARPGRHRPGARAEHHLLIHDADHPVGCVRRRRGLR